MSASRMWTVVVSTLAVSVVFGCASRQPAESSTGTIQGRFHEAGGSAPGVDNRVAGKISVYRDAAMTGTPVASAQTDPRGQFAITIAPGTYYLSGTTSSVSGARCAGPGAITVTAAIATTADVVCQLK